MSAAANLALIRRLVDGAADRVARAVVPVLAPLAADLVQYAAPRPLDWALDLGTGAGVVAGLLAPLVRAVIGLDVSGGALRLAPRAPNAAYVRADIHRLPFGAGCFSLVIASFGLNTTDPARSLRAARRCLAPGGRLVIQEWGPVDGLSAALDDLLAGYAVRAAGPELAQLRAALDALPTPWTNQLQDADDYREWLAELGLEVEDARECAPVAVRLEGSGPFFDFWRARVDRFEELRALDAAARAAFEAEARERLARQVDASGGLIWQPVVLRARARREQA